MNTVEWQPTRADGRRWVSATLVLLLVIAFAAAQPPVDQEAAFEEWVNTSWRKIKFESESAGRLKRLGLSSKNSIPLFISRLASEDGNVRYAAVQGLRFAGLEDPKAAFPALIQAARDELPEVRGAAVRGLAALGHSPAIAVPVIIEILENDERNTEEAASALARFGPHAKPAVNALIRLLKHKSDGTRDEAARALGGIGPEALAAISALRAAWNDKSERVRLSAAHAVWKIDAGSRRVPLDGLIDERLPLGRPVAAAEAIPILISLLDSKDSTMLDQTIVVLGGIGPSAEAAVPVLDKIRKRPNDHSSAYALWAVGRIRESKTLVQDLLQELENESLAGQMGIPMALALMGAEAEPAIPALRKLSEDKLKDAMIRFMAHRAIQHIEAHLAANRRRPDP